MSQPAPQPQPQSQTQPTTSDQPTPLDLGITLVLHKWPALAMAVTSHWGGPTSSDKRDWLCGAISDMLVDRPETDAEDLEDVLIQVMSDEFDVVVDDESADGVAREIMEIRGLTARGETGRVREMWEEWIRTKEHKGDVTKGFKRVESGEGDGEEGSSSEEDGEEDGDVEMDEAPGLVRRERTEPQVDEDGFTKVVGKKRR